MKLRLAFLLAAILSSTVDVQLADAVTTIQTKAIEIAQASATPVAQLDPSRPVQIVVVNAGDAPVICTLTQPASAERRVAPGDRTTFGSTTTSYLPLPINFLLYPEGSNIGISSYVSEENNVVTVVVGEQASETPGDIAMAIEPDGSIYLY